MAFDKVLDASSKEAHDFFAVKVSQTRRHLFICSGHRPSESTARVPDGTVFTASIALIGAKEHADLRAVYMRSSPDQKRIAC